MRRGLVLAMVLVLPACAPSAQACSWALPEAFQRFQWTGPAALLTQQGYDVGTFHLGNATFVARAEAFPALAFAAGPSGALAYAHGGDDPDGREDGASCALNPGVTEVVSADGSRVNLLEPAAMAMVSEGSVLVLLHRVHGALAYEWGSWQAPTRLGSLSELGEGAWQLALSPSGKLLAAYSSAGGNSRAVYVLDVASGRPLDAAKPSIPVDPSYPAALAFSPDERYLAFATSGGDREGRLRILDLRDGFRQVAERTEAEGIYALAWGAAGLAASATAHDADIDDVAARGVLRLFPRAPELAAPREASFPGGALEGGLAWSPDGSRLAAGGEGLLRLFDANLTLMQTLQPGSVIDHRPPPGSVAGGPPVGTPGPLGIPGPALALAVPALALAALRRRPQVPG